MIATSSGTSKKRLYLQKPDQHSTCLSETFVGRRNRRCIEMREAASALVEAVVTDDVVKKKPCSSNNSSMTQQTSSAAEMSQDNVEALLSILGEAGITRTAGRFRH